MADERDAARIATRIRADPLKLSAQKRYDDFAHALMTAHFEQDHRLFLSLVREAAKSLSRFNRHFVHLDIKPENFVLEKDKSNDGSLKVRIIDFGGARDADQPLTPGDRWVDLDS